jgi:CTP synthase
VHVVYIPWLNTSKELKTKPAQNALKDMQGFGIIPDVVVCRSERPAPREMCEKIAKFAGIPGEAVLNLPDIESVYDVPFNVLKSGVLEILNRFTGNKKAPDMKRWQEFSRLRGKKWAKTVRVGLVAKYVGNDDTYICVTEALKAAAAWNKVNLEIEWINAETATKRDFAKVDGLVVPGGFGARGAEGKIKAATYALEKNVPYLGLCLGMQMACVAAARKGKKKNANSEEFGAKSGENVIYIMDGQQGKESTGGTMRLGDYPAVLKKGSKTAKIYGSTEVVERHRHRYEVNQEFLPAIEKGGLVVSGTSPDGELVEFVESPKNRFFVATQAHPEFRSRPLNVHPLFMEFVKSLK